VRAPRKPGLFRYFGGDRPWPAVVVDGDEGEFGLGHFHALAEAIAEHPDLHIKRDRAAADPFDLGIETDGVADLDRGLNTMLETATVTVWPPARRVAVMLAAASIEAMIQPPKMSPDGLVSAGMARCRAESSPRGASACIAPSWVASWWSGEMLAVSMVRASCD
jgi:hypothetical protein